MFPDDDIFIDQSKTKAKKWREENDKKLNESDLVILIITPAALKSDEVEREVSIANNLNKLILPCKMNLLNLDWTELKWDIDTLDGIKFENDEDLRTTLFGEVDKIRKEFSTKLQNSSSPDSDFISIHLDKKTYSDGDKIIIYGDVKELLSNVPVSLRIVSPSDQLVLVSQIYVDLDKKYSTTVTAGGSLMQYEGDYRVDTFYGNSSRTAKTIFNFKGSTTVSKSLTTEDVIIVEGSNTQIKYRIQGGKVISAVKDPGISSLIIGLNSTEDGTIRLTIPRSFLDARIDNNDDDFFVLVNATEVNFDEIKTSDDRTLTIPFSLHSKEIEVIGISQPSKSLSRLFEKPESIQKQNEQIHVVSLSVSFDRTVYPLKSKLYVRVNCQDILFGRPINLEIANSDNKIIDSRQIDPITHPDSELKRAGIYQESFQMNDTDWKVGEVYTVRASHGNAIVYDGCTTDKRTPVIQTDESKYFSGSDMILTIIDPDADKDSQKVEIVGDSPESFLTISTSIDRIEGIKLLETGDSTGIFQGVIGLIGTLDDGTIMPYSHTENFFKLLQERNAVGVTPLRFNQNDTIKITYKRKSDVITLIAHATNKIDLGTKKYR